MKKLVLPLLATISFTAIASAQVLVSPIAEFRDPDSIAENIKEECGLPERQIELLENHLNSAKIDYIIADSNEIPDSGEFLLIELTSAISMGNAFMGHQKQVGLKATLFKDGEKVEATAFTRNSMGGVGAGFKGSCSVLGRCCKTLGKDVTKWLKSVRK